MLYAITHRELMQHPSNHYCIFLSLCLSLSSLSCLLYPLLFLFPIQCAVCLISIYLFPSPVPLSVLLPTNLSIPHSLARLPGAVELKRRRLTLILSVTIRAGGRDSGFYFLRCW